MFVLEGNVSLKETRAGFPRLNTTTSPHCEDSLGNSPPHTTSEKHTACICHRKTIWFGLCPLDGRLSFCRPSASKDVSEQQQHTPRDVPLSQLFAQTQVPAVSHLPEPRVAVMCEELMCQSQHCLSSREEASLPHLSAAIQ